MGKDENGKDVKIPGLLSPERIKAARPPQGEQPAFIILGGRGGSGKSSFKGEVYEPDRCIVLDADHIKSMLPEYEGWNAHQVHEESGELFDHVADFARIMGLNVVLDKTMKTAKSAIADVEKFKKSGYRTEAHYMHLPRQEAGKRAVKRFLDGGESGRFVPPEIVLSNTTNEAAFDQVRKMVDAWSFRDNNVAKGEKPILISQSGEPAMKSKEILRKSLLKSMIVVWRVKQ
jgi:predicted ABC-type ATPase